ncbi:MAG: hypothetical protein LUQ44_02775 [Methanothrix sp.]|nr:hypothetical protein [Methanothrix sp.]
MNPRRSLGEQGLNRQILGRGGFRPGEGWPVCLAGYLLPALVRRCYEKVDLDVGLHSP